MGNYVNKLLFHNDDQQKEKIRVQSPMEEESPEKDDMCTPPVIQKKLAIDPRSVTVGIPRTPIEVNCTPVGVTKRTISAIPKYLQPKPYLETDIDVVMPPLTPKKRLPRPMDIEKETSSSEEVENTLITATSALNNESSSKVITPIDKERYKVLGLDPRSPAADFDRTPILMPKSLECMRARSQENLYRRGSYVMDIYNSRFSYCETISSHNVPEIQAIPDMALNALKSLKLSNSNNIEELNRSESSSNCSSSIETISESGEEITVIKNPKLESNHGQNSMTNDKESKHEEMEINSELLDVEEHQKDSDKIKVWRDSLSSEETEDTELIVNSNGEHIEANLAHIPKEEIIITFDDDSTLKNTLISRRIKNKYNQKRSELGKKKKMVKPEIKITVDEKKLFSPDNKSGSDVSKMRTPLGNRSNNGQVQTVSSNSPQQVLRNKCAITKVQQENTPPHKRYVAKPKLSGIHWDPDSTVII